MATKSKVVNEVVSILQGVISGTKITTTEDKILIDGVLFETLTVSNITSGNKGLTISDYQKKSKDHELILIASYIPVSIANDFAKSGINYIDFSGNANIHYKSIHIQITGQKLRKLEKTRQTRAFQEVGIKLIFHLYNDPELLNRPYREIAKLANISLGSVGYVINELEDLNFILKTDNKKILKNKQDLIKRWLVAFNDGLRPRLIMRKMRFADKTMYSNWKSKLQHQATNEILWGGEPAASLMTNHLKPAYFTLYTTNDWQECGRKLGLITDDNGDVELLSAFWNIELYKSKQFTVPPLLVYSDLMNTGLERNLETAKIILDNEL